MSVILKDDKGALVVREGNLVKKIVRGKNYSGGRRGVLPEEMVDREVRALKMLSDVCGIQRFVKRISLDSFYTEYVCSNSLKNCFYKLSTKYFDGLSSIMNQCYEKGVLKLDLGRSDFLVSGNGDPIIIDFGNVLFLNDFVSSLPIVVGAVKLRNQVRIWDLKKRYASH